MLLNTLIKGAIKLHSAFSHQTKLRNINPDATSAAQKQYGRFYHLVCMAPTITHLAVHLQNGQRVYFTENNIHDVVTNPRDTTLTAFLTYVLKMILQKP